MSHPAASIWVQQQRRSLAQAVERVLTCLHPSTVQQRACMPKHGLHIAPGADACFSTQPQLLKRGGEVVFCGPLGVRSSALVAYLSAISGVTPIAPGVNPATW